MTQIIYIGKKKKKTRHHSGHYKFTPHDKAWSILRDHGFKRRISLGGWIADFLNQKQKIAVVISSPMNERDSIDDEHTDMAIKNHGYLVFRFRSDEMVCLGRVVLGNIEFEKSLARQR